MGTTDRVALGRFVLRTKEYLVAIRGAREGAHALHAALPRRGARHQGHPRRGRAHQASEVKQAVKLIEALSTDWDPAQYEDAYRKRLQAIVRKKRKGGEIKLPETDPERTQPVPGPDGRAREVARLHA